MILGRKAIQSELNWGKWSGARACLVFSLEGSMSVDSTLGLVMRALEYLIWHSKGRWGRNLRKSGHWNDHAAGTWKSNPFFRTMYNHHSGIVVMAWSIFHNFRKHCLVAVSSTKLLLRWCKMKKLGNLLRACNEGQIMLQVWLHRTLSRTFARTRIYFTCSDRFSRFWAEVSYFLKIIIVP